jgi:hypothetical protein
VFSPITPYNKEEERRRFPPGKMGIPPERFHSLIIIPPEIGFLLSLLFNSINQ